MLKEDFVSSLLKWVSLFLLSAAFIINFLYLFFFDRILVFDLLFILLYDLFWFCLTLQIFFLNFAWEDKIELELEL